MSADKTDPKILQAEPVDTKVIDAEIKAEKSSTSKGEKLFDWLTYGGIAGVGTFLVTIPIAYWAKYGGGGKYFAKSTQFLQKQGFSEHTAEQFMMTTATMQGGNVTVIPVKLMENHKPELVEKFNKMLGDKSVDASVEEDPKQTWNSLIKSRVAAWLAVFTGFKMGGALFGNEKFAVFENSFAEHIVCKPLGRPTHIPGLAKIAENETKLFRYGKIAAIDVFATTAATILLYMGSRFFAKKNDKWHAQHTHINPITKESELLGSSLTLPFEPKAPEPVKEADTPAPKRFADDIKPRVNTTPQKNRLDTFADTLNTQKTSPSDPSLILGA